MFSGTITALATPFKDQAVPSPAIDFEDFERLLNWQIEKGVQGVVVCGSTGEAATLAPEEKLELTKLAVSVVKGRVPVIMGSGTNDTKESAEMSLEAKRLGVDGVLLVAPYYNKPNQEGLYQHFSYVAKECGLPTIVYNIPGRSVVEISVETLERLATVPNIVALKQSVDSVTRLVELADRVSDKLAILAGDDPIVHAVMANRGKGVISASATAIPEDILAITQAALEGDMEAALSAQIKALPKIKAMFSETNPIPVKAALKLRGIFKSEAVRLPLTKATPATINQLKTLL